MIKSKLLFFISTQQRPKEIKTSNEFEELTNSKNQQNQRKQEERKYEEENGHRI